MTFKGKALLLNYAKAPLLKFKCHHLFASAIIFMPGTTRSYELMSVSTEQPQPQLTNHWRLCRQNILPLHVKGGPLSMCSSPK